MTGKYPYIIDTSFVSDATLISTLSKTSLEDIRALVQQEVHKALHAEDEQTVRLERDETLIRDAQHDVELAQDLKGRLIRIEAPNLAQSHSRVVYVDTGEDVPGVRRVELTLDMQTGMASVKLCRWKQKTCQGATLEYAMTDLVQGITALARIDVVEEE